VSDEVGVNVVAGMSKGEAAEELAEAMAGLNDTFETMLEDVRSPTAEFPVRQGYDKFLEKMSPFMADLERHGLRLAENIQAGASEAAQNDYESSQEFEGAWPGLNRDIND